MMSVEKKLTWVLLLVMIIGGSVFAQERIGRGNTPANDFSLSAGGRIFYNGIFDIWEYSYTGYGGAAFAGMINSYPDNRNNGFGIGGFFDATYVEIGMDFLFSSLTPNSGDAEINATYFGFTILGKFPIVADPITFFPLAGIDFQIFLSGESGGFTIKRDYMKGDDAGSFDAFSLVVGAGLDFSLNDKLYLRGEVLINFRMEDDFDKMLKKSAKENDVDYSGMFSMGPRVSVGVGYRFPAKGTK